MFQRCKKLCLTLNMQSRYKNTLSKAEARERRNLLFEEEKKRQTSAVGRIEKIEVKYHSPVEQVILVMNKFISTPTDCARHISEGVCKMSALALVDDKPWDMNKPLKSDCELQFLNLLSPKDNVVNRAFWRTCSFVLGAVIDTSFQPDITVHLHSFPIPIIKSGSFVYDVYLELNDWVPTDQELRAFSAQYMKIVNQELPVERLEVTENLALEMFQDNPVKTSQIPNIAEINDNKVILYRIGDHIDISKGPMLGNTSLIGRCTIAAIHKVPEQENLYRFQGIALPKGILLNQFAYGILEKRARRFNDVIHFSQLTEKEQNEDIVKMMSRN